MTIPSILLTYSFVAAAAGSVLIGMVSGALGVFAILRKQSLLGDVISHTSFFGITAAFLLAGLAGGNPRSLLPLLIGAVLSGVLSMMVVNHVNHYSRIAKDTGMAMVLSVFFGIGAVLLRVVQELRISGSAGLETFIYGSAAAITRGDLRVIILFTAVAALLLGLFWKEFTVFTFNPEYAHSQGFTAKYLEPLLLAILVIGVVIGLQAVGVILMVSLIVAPGLAARQWTRHLGLTVVLAGIFGAASGLTGTVISALAGDLPTGPVIVLVLTGLAGFSLLFAPGRGVIASMLRRARRRRAARRTGFRGKPAVN